MKYRTILLFGAPGVSFAARAAALFVPGLRNLFGPPLGIADFGISVAAGAAPLLAIEILRGAQSQPVPPATVTHSLQ